MSSLVLKRSLSSLVLKGEKEISCHVVYFSLKDLSQMSIQLVVFCNKRLRVISERSVLFSNFDGCRIGPVSCRNQGKKLS